MRRFLEEDRNQEQEWIYTGKYLWKVKVKKSMPLVLINVSGYETTFLFSEALRVKGVHMLRDL